MDEAIGSASSTQLLILIGMTLAGVLLFGSLITVYFFRRSGGKSKMKLGSQPASAQPDSRAAVSASPQQGQPFPQDELDVSILSQDETLPSTIFPPEPDTTIHNPETETHLEDPNMNTSYDSGEQINLSERLSGLSSHTPAPSSEPVELLRLLRDPKTGQLIVEVAGQRYTRLAEVADKKIGQYILKLVGHMLAFTNGVIATDSGVKSVYYPKVTETPAPIVASTQVPPSPRPAPVTQPGNQVNQDRISPVTDQLVASSDPALLTSPLTQSIADVEEEPRHRRGLFGFSRPSTGGSRLPMLNLAGQINDIVQARLAHSPLASNPRVEILGEPGGGIRIRVNGASYTSPDDIPDVEIKELIKSAIKEWERS